MKKKSIKEINLFRRKNYFIQKPFQLRLALIIFLSMLTMVSAAMFSVYLFNWRLISYFFIQKGIYINLYGVFQQANLNLVSQLLALSVLIAFASLFVSHKIAGPAYRLEHNIHAILKGDLTVNSKLRKNDELQFLAISLESLTEKLNGEFRNNRRLLQNISSSLEVISGNLKSGEMNLQEAEAGLNKTKSLVEELKWTNAQFQLKAEK